MTGPEEQEWHHRTRAGKAKKIKIDAASDGSDDRQPCGLGKNLPGSSRAALDHYIDLPDRLRSAGYLGRADYSQLFRPYDEEEFHRAAKERLGDSFAFKGFQKKAIASICERQNVSVMSGTGTGKNLCFQALALRKHAIILVISPLEHVPEGHVEDLKRLGISATCIHRKQNSVDHIRACGEGAYQVVYTTPKMLHPAREAFPLLGHQYRTFNQRLLCIVVDDAHLVQEWGTSYEPPYAGLGALKRFVPMVPWMFLSNSLTPFNKETILRLFRFQEKDIAWVKEDVNRADMYISVRPVLDEERPFADILAALPIKNDTVEPTVIYVEVGTTTRLKEYLVAVLPPALRDQVWVYHTGCSDKTQARCREAWKEGRFKIMIATEYLGMESHWKNISVVIQYGHAPSIGSVWRRFDRCQFDRKKPGQCIWLMRGWRRPTSPRSVPAHEVGAAFRARLESAPVLMASSDAGLEAGKRWRAFTKDLIILFKRERWCYRQLFMLYLGENIGFDPLDLRDPSIAGPDETCCDLCYYRKHDEQLRPMTEDECFPRLPQTEGSRNWESPEESTPYAASVIDRPRMLEALKDARADLYQEHPHLWGIISEEDFLDDEESMVSMIDAFIATSPGEDALERWLSSIYWAWTDRFGRRCFDALKAVVDSTREDSMSVDSEAVSDEDAQDVDENAINIQDLDI